MIYLLLYDAVSVQVTSVSVSPGEGLLFVPFGFCLEGAATAVTGASSLPSDLLTESS